LPPVRQAIHASTNSHVPFIFKYIANFENLLFDNLMVLFNREGSFRTESSPMESCRPAIIVSFGVTAHGLLHPSVSEGDGSREAGIDSVAEFRV
jgi:hypothetical protein